jgi:hypothetical protein
MCAHETMVDHRKVYEANRVDAERALAYLNEVVKREIVGMSVIRHALESIAKRSAYASE